MKNERDLLLVRERIDADGPVQHFHVLEPQMWTIFSRIPVLVQGSDGVVYELSADFPDMLHAAGCHVRTSLIFSPFNY